MSSIIVPRYELPLLDPASGRMTRAWYTFFAQMAKATGSLTNSDDAAIQDAMDATEVESLLASANTLAKSNTSLLMMEFDQQKPADVILLAYWP